MRTIDYNLAIMLIICLTLSMPARAQQSKNVEKWAKDKAKLGAVIENGHETGTRPSGWKGEAELGMVATGGNTETATINAKFGITTAYRKWTHNGHFELLSASDNGETSSEKYLLAVKSYRDFGKHNYLFALALYEDDRFSGFEYQVTLSTGYGHNFISSQKMKFSGEIGAGSRQIKPDSEEKKNEGVISIAGAFDWKLSKTADFRQTLGSYVGEDMTISKSVSALKVQVVGNLATKLSFTIKHTNDVPVDTEKTDYETAITLVFSL